MTSVDDMRGSVTAVTESASAALRRVRGQDGLLLLGRQAAPGAVDARRLTTKQVGPKLVQVIHGRAPHITTIHENVATRENKVEGGQLR